MFDDQDGCEWVSVSSGTGLGLYTRVVPEQRQLNGCVCVCVCVCVHACVRVRVLSDQFCQIYPTDFCQIFRVGRTTAVDDQSEISFLIPQRTLRRQPVFVGFIHRTDSLDAGS